MTDQKTKDKGPRIVYKVQGDIITRQDTTDANADVETVARYDEKHGIVELVKGKEQYKIAIIRHLNDKAHKFVEIGYIGMEKELSNPQIPKKPKKSMLQGEKSTQLVEWYARYHPKIFLAKYGVQQMQVRTGFRTEQYQSRNRETGKEETLERQVPIYENVEDFDYNINSIKTGEHRLIGRCQTHLTEKMTADSDISEYDEDLDAELNVDNRI